MRQFGLIFLRQLIKIIFVLITIVFALHLGYRFMKHEWLFGKPFVFLVSRLDWLTFNLALAAGFLGAVSIVYLIEYRRRLSVRSFISEVLLMLFALSCFFINIFFIIFAVSGILLIWDVSAVIVTSFGILFAAFATAIWKLVRAKNLNAPETKRNLP